MGENSHTHVHTYVQHSEWKDRVTPNYRMLRHPQTHTYEIKNTSGHNSLSLNGSKALKFSTKLVKKKYKDKMWPERSVQVLHASACSIGACNWTQWSTLRHRITQHWSFSCKLQPHWTFFFSWHALSHALFAFWALALLPPDIPRGGLSIITLQRSS